MDYFTVDLQRALTNYVTAIGHVSQWKQHHDKDEVIAKHDFVVRSLERTLSDTGPLSRDNLIAVFSVVLNMVGNYIPWFLSVFNRQLPQQPA